MIDPTIGRKPLQSLTPLDVQRWIDGLARHGFKPSTVHAAVAVLMGALREAALLGITDRHVGQGIRRPKLGQVSSTTWAAPEIKRVLAAVAGDELWSALYHVAIATGMRPGELRGLKWDCVDLDRGLVTERRTITKDVDGHEVIADRTKSKQARTVALAPHFVEVLRWHRIRQHERRLAHASWHQTDVVFDRGDGQFVNLSSWQRFHRALCERAGVPQIRAHDIRHTYATLLMERNVHPRGSSPTSSGIVPSR
jgi:integrase